MTEYKPKAAGAKAVVPLGHGRRPPPAAVKKPEMAAPTTMAAAAPTKTAALGSEPLVQSMVPLPEMLEVNIDGFELPEEARAMMVR